MLIVEFVCFQFLGLKPLALYYLQVQQGRYLLAKYLKVT